MHSRRLLPRRVRGLVYGLLSDWNLRRWTLLSGLHLLDRGKIMWLACSSSPAAAAKPTPATAAAAVSAKPTPATASIAVAAKPTSAAAAAAAVAL